MKERNLLLSSIDYRSIPRELRPYDGWVCWRYHSRPNGKPAKIPVTPQSGQPANVRDPATWGGYLDAVRYLHLGRILDAGMSTGTSTEGIGFVFSENDPYTGIDLDECVDENGEIVAWAREIIDRVDSYTEFSPSRTGVHILVKGKVPAGRTRSGQIEMYDSARYFTVTGAHVPGTPRTIEQRQEALDAIHADLVAETESQSQSGLSQVGGDSTVTLEDDVLLRKAKAARNGTSFERLWAGDTSGYASQSEADQALACHLAFWTGGDRHQMGRLFRHSGLMRDKWDRRHGSDGRTYGEMTIDAALGLVDNYYGN